MVDGRIYINNQIAGVVQYPRAGSGMAVPFYVDYIVHVEMEGAENRPQIIIALVPDVHNGNVSLNGIELFKVSNASENLTVSNPELSSPKTSQDKAKARRRRKWVTPASGGIAGFFIMVLLMCYMFIWRHRKRRSWLQGLSNRPSWSCLGVKVYRGKSSKRKSKSLPEELYRHFSLDEIKAATDNFHDDLVIGKGGFGNVYKGFLDNGEQIVAIKRL